LTFLKKADIVLPEMKTYKINVVWQMYGSVEVEANSLEEAVKEVDDGVSLPDNGEYIDGSFEVDVEGSALNEVD
jgi:hypothetical protein